jgi:hypothetical protein
MGDDDTDEHSAEEPALALLRERPENRHLLRGFGPLAVGVVLFVLMVLLVPSVAPEHVVERPKGGDKSGQVDDNIVTTSSTAASSTTATTGAP